MRLGDGTRLAPIPVRRYRCSGTCGTFSRLPTFLCRYIRSLANVVATAFQDRIAGRPTKEIPLGMAGPSFITVYRWLAMLRCPRIRAWLEEKAQAFNPELVPLKTQCLITRSWALACKITDNSENSPAALVQWAKLRYLLRYSSPTYSNS